MKKLILYLSIGLLFNTSSLADTKCFLAKENEKLSNKKVIVHHAMHLAQRSKSPLV